MKRRLLIIAIFLLLGAVVNVAVAWGCALWVPYSKTAQLQVVGSGSLNDQAVFDVFRAFGSEFVLGPSGDGGGFYTDRNDHVNVEWPRRGDWSRGRTLGPLEYQWSSRIGPEEARGWPALSLSWHYWGERTFNEYGNVSSNTTWSLRYGWPCGGTRVVQYGKGGAWSLGLDARIIPYRPIWRGFAVNTLLYATILWLLIHGPSGVRRFRGFLRLRRGLCPKCAYPMGESSVCTECGGALAKRR